MGLVEDELREMLTRYGYNGKEAPAVRGSAKLALEEPADEPTELGRVALNKYVVIAAN